jgi:D-alanine-D-alanine ligase
VALDKDWARSLAVGAGACVPWGRLYHGPDDPGGDPLGGADAVPWPVIAKPVWEGSSKGIRRHCLIERPGLDGIGGPRAVLDSLWNDYRQPILVEEFIAGDEVTVGVLGPTHAPHVLGVMRVLPRRPTERFVYSLEVKRDFRRLVRYECPARLPGATLAEIERLAVRIYTALGCRDVARIDFRLRDGVPYFLEANPLPGLNPESSDLVILAEAVGVRHEQLIGRILDAALERLGGEGVTE